jgi:hypothetical protein
LTLEKHVTPGEGADQQTNDPTDQEGSDIASNAGSGMFSLYIIVFIALMATRRIECDDAANVLETSRKKARWIPDHQ